MFTGITETTASVLSFQNSQLIIQRPDFFDNLHKGQSIAVNGACLSIVAYDDTQMVFDVVPETFLRTNLSHVSSVNLERALRADGRFEGHIVLGHIDETVSLSRRVAQETGAVYTFDIPSCMSPESRNCLLPKGSVALNGISLTIASVSSDSFSVALIPHTLEHTNMGSLQEHDCVNLERDYIAKIHTQCSFHTA